MRQRTATVSMFPETVTDSIGGSFLGTAGGQNRGRVCTAVHRRNGTPPGRAAGLERWMGHIVIATIIALHVSLYHDALGVSLVL